jgi:hypothetical protein
MHRKRYIFSTWAVGYVRRLQNADDCSSSSESSESGQSFGSSGIYSEAESCYDSDSDLDQNVGNETSDSDADCSSNDSAIDDGLHSEGQRQHPGSSSESMPAARDEFEPSASILHNPINTAESMFVAEEVNTHVDKLMDETTKLGSIPVEFDADGNMKIVPQVYDYHFRPTEFLHFSLFEYVLTTKRVPIKSNSADTESLSDSNESDSSSENDDKPRKRGRKPNVQYRFQQQHPLYKSHVVTIMPKHCIPHFVTRVPNYPGDRPDNFESTATWKAQAREFVAFALVVYKPWSGRDGLPESTPWEAFCDYMHALSVSQTLINRSHLAYITIAAHGLKYSQAACKILKWFRASNATRWLDMQPHLRPKAWMFGDETNEEKNCAQRATQQQAELAMNELLYKTVLASPHDKRKESLIQHVVSVVHETFDIGCECSDSRAPSESTTGLPGSFPNIAERLNCFTADSITAVNDHNKLSESESLNQAEMNIKQSQQRKTGNKKGHTAATRENASESEPVQWSFQQKKIIDQVSNYIDSMIRWKDAGCIQSQRPKGLTLLIFGAPGVGKTEVLKKLTKMCRDASLPLLCAAYTGVAAGSMLDAKTLHSQYLIPVPYL